MIHEINLNCINKPVWLASRSYHRKLTAEDKKPICSLCNQTSLYYCIMNDEYYCSNHILGHDENE
jgi:hypothetical protein